MKKILNTALGTPSARPITNASQTELYKPTWAPIRPGSDDHEKIPSRRVQTREWRDGRKEQA